jgi:ribosomal protein L29
MEAKELREKSIKQLQKLLKKTREDMQSYKVDLIQEKEKDISKIRKFKKDCARILTVLNEKRSKQNA